MVWPRRLLYLPIFLVVAAGITFSTSRAVYEGLTRWGGTFRRTPKFRLEGREGRWADSVYRLRPDWTILGEFGLMAYALAGLVLAWQQGQYGSMPFLLLCALGYGIVAWTGLWQSRPALRRVSGTP